ncbi:hypothetical protein ACFYQA_24760 [Streptomyces sp. NPDC005774]
MTDRLGLAGSVSLSAEAENALVRLSAGPTPDARQPPAEESKPMKAMK